MSEPTRSEDEYEEVEVSYEDEEGEMVDDEFEDPDFSPGEEGEEPETESISLEEETASLGEVSDTNAPYADAGEQQEKAGTSKGVRMVNPLKLLGKLRPRELVAMIRGQRKRIQRLVWRLEDASVLTAKFAVKAAVKGARPLLVWLVVARTLRTIDRSEDLGLRMMRQPTNKQMDYYYSHLLGKDWEQQMEQDFIDAVAEVDAGYITDDMVRERRGIQAAIMRRLEVEEWDKERMRHFYYGLYGLGPWYWDMEERLHNPFFIGARGWNGPPESWINENQTFPRDMPASARDPRLQAAKALGDLRDQPLSREVTAKLFKKESLRNADLVLASPVFKGVDHLELKQQIEERQEQQQLTPA